MTQYFAYRYGDVTGHFRCLCVPMRATVYHLLTPWGALVDLHHIVLWENFSSLFTPWNANCKALPLQRSCILNFILTVTSSRNCLWCQTLWGVKITCSFSKGKVKGYLPEIEMFLNEGWIILLSKTPSFSSCYELLRTGVTWKNGHRIKKNLLRFCSFSMSFINRQMGPPCSKGGGR